ncbi:MAG TPA: cytochrome c [Stellaceae bacterium]|nr:cytochrome c [Stellaceae bacterium]
MRGMLLAGTALLLGLGAGAALAGGAGPPPLDHKQVAFGRTVYKEYCASCHGPHGEGQPNWQEPNAQGDMPAPPHNATGHTWKHADSMLYRIVAGGWRDPFNKSRQLTMPSFGDQLTPAQIRAVITYLKTLWTPEERKFQWEETEVRGGFPSSSAASHQPGD